MPGVYLLGRHPESLPGFDENRIGAGKAPIPLPYDVTGNNATREGLRQVPPDGLIHLLHFLAATFRRGRPGRSILKGVALLTEVALLLGLRGRRFCILVLTIAVTTHKHLLFT
jgi:hypothetical protein